MNFFVFLPILLIQSVFCSNKLKSPLIETVQFKVLQKYERPSPLYYTQGLLFKDDNTLLESAGLYGESAIHFINLSDMKVQKETTLDKQFFAEGCDIITNNNGEKLTYQMTWMERKVFVYDSEKLVLKKTFELPSEILEGWGMTHYTNTEGKTKFLITDGSDNVFVVDPDTMKVDKSISIVDENDNPLSRLNELEMVGDKLLSNVYLTNMIVAIDLNKGKVVKSFDMSSLVNEVRNSKVFKANNFDYGYCLNGIAYNQNNKKLLITGKKWPFVYEIELKDFN